MPAIKNERSTNDFKNDVFKIKERYKSKSPERLPSKRMAVTSYEGHWKVATEESAKQKKRFQSSH